ncbi:MAG TPA: CNNM domain-containing protein, partial [Ignavibacteriales bacterium]|nr:CNNM domain-containing protein [Ignavibacteriales bacterium]
MEITILPLIILFFSLLLSGYFSSTEIAFVVSNKLKIKLLGKKEGLLGKAISYFTNFSNYFFSTILIGNNLVNILFSTFFSLIFSYYLSDFWILIISTLLVLLIGEIIPKIVAKEIPDTVLTINIIPLYWINYLIYPVVILFARLSDLFIINSKFTEDSLFDSFSKKDIEMIVEESKQAGIVNEKESNIISNILEISQTRVGEIVRPRTEIVGIEINQSIDDLLNLHKDTGYSKYPVYEKNLDNILGYVQILDCFNNPQTIKEILREI